MSKLEPPIDYEALEMQLQEAIKADELYQLQNDAKLRAVEQRVPTYEHFRQMVGQNRWIHFGVNGAHLRPLERKDTKPKIGVPWNRMTNKTSDNYLSHEVKEEDYTDTKET